jgi:predicted GTPase
MSDDRKQDDSLPDRKPQSKFDPQHIIAEITQRFPKDEIVDFWQNTTQKLQQKLQQLLPWVDITKNATDWFQVSDRQIAEILTEVRKELPTTEAWLIGKPQAGKSSIVRGLTGVSAEIVGQGFQPHTQHTKRYTYPSEDLPLLIFTDTVGLGDLKQETQTIIEELEAELQQKQQCARILILTVKINDFATDNLRQIAQELREIPSNSLFTSDNLFT